MQNNWVIRKIHDQNKPSTLGEIHQKAKMEQQEQQFLNSQPRMDSNPQSRGAKGKGRERTLFLIFIVDKLETKRQQLIFFLCCSVQTTLCKVSFAKYF